MAAREAGNPATGGWPNGGRRRRRAGDGALTAAARAAAGTGQEARARVLVDAPPALAAKARWVIETLATAAAFPIVFVDHPGATSPAEAGLALAYAPLPVDGVPTIPLSGDALRVIGERRPLPPQSFRRFDVSATTGSASGEPSGLAGAFAVEEPGFAVPFDMIASAFVLLSCWDEYTSDQRDRHGRFPFAAGVFAQNEALEPAVPVCDDYAQVLRALVRGQAGGRSEVAGLSDQGAERSDGPAFLVALTHDVDGLQRWSVRGWIAWARRVVVYCRSGDLARARWELRSAAYHLRHDLPKGRDAAFTFPDLLSEENRRGVSSTFYALASHTHPTDGNQPANYRSRLPAALQLIAGAGREVGLHGNHRDSRDLASLLEDRGALARLIQTARSAIEANAETDGGGRTWPVTGNRFHYLKCLYHQSLPLLEAAGFHYDTTLAFAEHEGFRCGISHPFHPYCMAEDRPLQLIELPLAVMDSTLQERHYRHLDAAGARDATIAVLERVRRSSGCAAILWHHNRFHPYVGMGYGQAYWDVVDWVHEHGGECTGAAEAISRWRAQRLAADSERRRARPLAGPEPDEGTQTPAGDMEKPAGEDLSAAVALHSPRASGGRASRRPRVVHLSVVHRADDPRIFERECRTLAERGYDVEYIAPRAGSAFVDGVHLANLPRRSRKTRWMSGPQILSLLHRLQPDVVHVHDPELLTLFPALRPFTPALVYDMHEYLSASVGSKFYIPKAVRSSATTLTAGAQRRLAALSDGVCCVVAEQFDELGARPPLRIELPNYPRVKRFSGAVVRPEMAAETRLKLAYVGSLTRNRGVRLMLDVLGQVEDAVLYLGGTFSNPDFEAEVRRRAEAELAGRVHLLGRVDPADVPSVLAGADVVWIPSLPTQQYSRPTLATKMFEGMAVGLAVLASDLPGRREVVEGKRCGLVVAPTVEGHVEGLRALARDRGELAAMGARARAAVESEYSWEAIEGRLIDFYAELLGRRRRTVQRRPDF